jgi:thioredoxin-dependent peroxiredoxin
MTLKIGDKAPDFVLPADDGSSVSLRGLAGKPVVLFFYPKDDTSSCTAEAKDFSALAADFDKAGVVLIGMSPDSVKKHVKFKLKHGLGVTLVADEAKEALNAYGVWAEKSMYGQKYMGVLRTTFLIGGDGRIKRIWEKVKVADHASEALRAARELQAGT